ncbi:unnamed protein product [Prunus armeniaca]
MASFLIKMVAKCATTPSRDCLRKSSPQWVFLSCKISSCHPHPPFMYFLAIMTLV